MPPLQEALEGFGKLRAHTEAAPRYGEIWGDMGRYAHTEAAEAACTSPTKRQLSHSYRSLGGRGGAPRHISPYLPTSPHISQACAAAYLASRVHATAGATAERDVAAQVFVAAERAATLAAQRPLGRLADYAAEGVLEAHARRGAELLESHVCTRE